MKIILEVGDKGRASWGTEGSYANRTFVIVEGCKRRYFKEQDDMVMSYRVQFDHDNTIWNLKSTLVEAIEPTRGDMDVKTDWRALPACVAAAMLGGPRDAHA